MATMKCEIITPNGSIFSGDISSVTVPGSEGEFGVLPEHAGLVSLLANGVIEIEKSDKSKELVAINWGHIKVDEGKVTILADGAVAISGSGTEIASALGEAKELINSMSDSDVAIATATAKLESAAKGNF
ncbi:MAG: F0F1 ATP synthase subunit epsilon [Epsilonproteobacteria bacterium]|nr:F0F1 ATP synthase subunit epsilon [Campylobacterota bacterium]